MNSTPFSAPKALLALLLLGVASQASAATIVYNDFSSVAGLQLNGHTATAPRGQVFTGADGWVLRLTDGLSQGGSAFSTTAVPLQNSNSFSTYFSFRISDPQGASDGDGQGADGITFTVQTVSNTAGGIGGGIGYQGILNSVAVEFDTWNNGEPGGGNHVGINLNGSVNSVVSAAVGTRMNNGALWHAWVDYDGLTDALEVRLAQNNIRPLLAMLTHTVDLQTVLGQNSAYVGFTSGTGAAGGDHDIASWEFRDDFNPVNTPDAGATSAMMLAGLATLAFARRSRSRA